MKTIAEYPDFLLFQGKSEHVIQELTGQVDMIFADPPYFLSGGGGKTVRGNRIIDQDYGEWDKVRSEQEKDEFNMQWLKACRNVLKDDGTIWVSGTYHNIYSVTRCMIELGYKILNVIIWQKVDPPPSLTESRFNFSTESIVWAAKSPQSKYYLNSGLMKQMNGGKQMTDVWRIPSTGTWEKTCGKHPTQKPLRLLYRIILASTREGETVFDPFAESCTTGIAANLLGRKFIGIDQDEKFLQLGMRRRAEINVPEVALKIFERMSENPEEVQVVVNYARPELLRLMIEKGIAYLRAGDSKGSVLVTPGFERAGYVLLHSSNQECHLFKLRRKGCFQIWTKESLEAYGFHPEHALYYVVFHFDNSHEIPFTREPRLLQGLNTYRSKIRPHSDFIGIR